MIRTIATAATVLVLAGCGASTAVTNSPVAQAPSTTAAAATTAAPTDTPSTPAVAKVGSTIHLTAPDGTAIDVTLVKFAATSKSTNEYENPQAGNRYAAAQFKVTNVGSAAWTDSPTNGAKAIDAQGQQFNATFTMGSTAGPVFPGSVKLMPGKSAMGVIVFEVPKGAKITSVQYGAASGFGDTGEWTV